VDGPFEQSTRLFAPEEARMARRPNDNERTSLSFDPLHGSHVVRPRRVRAIALLAITALVGAVATLAVPGVSGAAANDPAGNSVRALGGAPAYGPNPGLDLNGNFVGIAAMSKNGYVIAGADGGVFARGQARYYGSAAGKPLVGPIRGIAARPDGDGYWLAAADGGVFSFGNADFYGSLGGYMLGTTPLQGEIVGIAATHSGKGYWLLGRDGGVFGFGDAGFYGSGAQVQHDTPFVGIAASRNGKGYYLLELNGGVHTFGDAKFAGSAVGRGLAFAISTSGGRGYQVALHDGNVAGFGGAASYASPADPFANRHPAIGIASRRGGGAWVMRTHVPPPPPEPVEDISQHPFLVCTRAHESDSAGGYRAVSPGGSFRGAYQFLQSTWNSTARHAGRLDLVGVDPAQAAPHDQDLMALELYHSQGKAPWGGRC
jgi:hypothetical protein